MALVLEHGLGLVRRTSSYSLSVLKRFQVSIILNTLNIVFLGLRTVKEGHGSPAVAPLQRQYLQQGQPWKLLKSVIFLQCLDICGEENNENKYGNQP